MQRLFAGGYLYKSMLTTTVKSPVLYARPMKRIWRRYIFQRFINFFRFLRFLLPYNPPNYSLLSRANAALRVYKGHIPLQVYAVCSNFISTRFSISQRLNVLLHHQHKLRNSFRPETIKQLLGEGVTCYSETIPSGKIEVVLKANEVCFYEGALSIILYFNGKIIFWMFFTMAPKSLLQAGDDTIIISCVQLKGKHYDDARTVTKEMLEISPARVLLYCIEGIAKALNAGNILGIATTDHILYKEIKDLETFNNSYTEFWQSISESRKEPLGYVIPLPLQHKPLEEIKQNHRSRALRKQSKLDEISLCVARQIGKCLSAAQDLSLKQVDDSNCAVA